MSWGNSIGQMHNAVTPSDIDMMREFSGQDLGQFNVIQGQRSWYYSNAHGWFPVRPAV